MNQNPKFSRQKSGCASGAKILQTKVGMRLWRKNSKSRSSITLIELLIAISLLTLILFAGSGIYLSGWNMFREAQFMAQAQRNALIPMAHIVKHINRGTGGCVTWICNYTSIFAPGTWFRGIGFYELQDLDHKVNTVYTLTDHREMMYYPNYNMFQSLQSQQHQVIGESIQSANFTISHVYHDELGRDICGIVVNIEITALDNAGGHPYTLRTSALLRYSPFPPLDYPNYVYSPYY